MCTRNDISRPTAFISALALLVFAACAVTTRGATYVVTNTNDAGDGSLRAAVAATEATAENDTIVFSIPNCPGNVCTINLTDGGQIGLENDAAGTLTITNSGSNTPVIISGGHTTRIFYLFSGNASRHLTLDSVTLDDGRAPIICVLFGACQGFFGGGV